MFHLVRVVTANIESLFIVLEGWEITITFTITESLPPVLLTSSDWRFTTFFGTQMIAEEDPRFTFGSEFMSVTIDPVIFEDECTYTLNAYNESGLIGSASIVM